LTEDSMITAPIDRPPDIAFKQEQPTYGRTGYDFLSSTSFKIFFLSCIAGFFIWLSWDLISSIPLYTLSAILLSGFWYNPIASWLSRSSTYIEVWDNKTNTLTTWRVGKEAMASFERIGIANHVNSLTGNIRIFASYFDPDNGVLETSWVHDCDPWSYHRDRRTLVKLTKRVTEVLDDISDANAMAQIEGRRHAMTSMQKHYADLDNLFFGDTEVTTDDIQTPESHTTDTQ
jgi:hypothetical protein